jgi:hypothetical protein
MKKMYAGSEWLQQQLNALKKVSSKKNVVTEMSQLGIKAADLLGEWQYGIYHLSQKEPC